MSFRRLMWSTKRRQRGQVLACLLVVGLPTLSYPLSWLPRRWAHFRFEETVRWPEIVLAAGLLVSAGLLLRGRPAPEGEQDRVAGNLPRYILLPLLATMASAIVAIRFSECPQFGLEILPRLVGNVVIFLLAMRTAGERPATLCQWWMIAAVMVAANGLLRLGSEPEFLSTLGNPDFLGTYLAASIIIGVSIGGTWSMLGNLVLVTAMCFCRSRGAWLALGAVAMLWFLDGGNRLVRRWHVRAAVLLFLVAGAGWWARPYVVRQWQTDVRPMIWKATLHMIAARPLLGHGLGTYVAEYPQYRLPEYFLRPKSTNVTDHAHNELLEVAAEQGLIGLTAILWLWATAVWCGVRACRRTEGRDRRLMQGLVGATLVLMFHGLVDVDLRHLPDQSLLWLLMGFLAGTHATATQRKRITIQSGPARWCAAAVCLLLGAWIGATTVILPMMADWRDREARLAEENGDLNATAQRAGDALRLQPFRLGTRYLLTGALARLPEPQVRDMAIDQCLRIEELAPDYADVTFNLGQLYMAANRARDAIPYLRRAVEINPYKPDRRVALAVAWRDVGENTEAVRELDRALQMQPDDQDARILRQDILKERPLQPF
jgi:O-antigen ligase